MQILHAAAVDGHLLLWGEVPPWAGTKQSKPSRRRATTPPKLAAPLLYDAGVESLAAACGAAGFSLRLNKRSTSTATIWLPSTSDGPPPSSPLIDEVHGKQAKTQLAPWTITVVRLSLDQMVGLIGATCGRRNLAPGVVAGEDLVFWSAALRLAAALVARGQFLPSLEPGADLGNGRRGTVQQACAVWEPVLLGEDEQRLSSLAQAMPGVARAVSDDPDAPASRPSLVVLRTLLTRLVDHLVRQGASGDIPARGAPNKRSTADNIHDRWTSALRKGASVVKAGASELHTLQEQIAAWQRPIKLLAGAPFRLCFRLDEPAATNGRQKNGRANRGRGNGRPAMASLAGGTWHVRYFLQAANDPSLLIPTPSAWKLKGKTASLLRRNGFDAQQYTLAALGQACEICPHVETSLQTTAPGGYELDATGAFEFLSERALAIRQAGFGVMLPAWWTTKGAKQRLVARAHVKSPAMQGSGGLSLDELVTFHWEIALGATKVSRRELEQLALLKAPLVRFRGQWVQLDAQEIREALNLMTRRSAVKLPAREIVQLALGAGSEHGTLRRDGVRATGWVAKLLKQLQERDAIQQLDAPEGFQGTLRPYQERGYAWLALLKQWGLGACLADDMGLGKTIQALALIERDWDSQQPQPTLLVCPTSVMGNWQKEVERFTPDLPVMVHHGTTRGKSAGFKRMASRHALVITSYSLLHRDEKLLQSVRWGAVVLDEAQNIKNAQTKQARAARQLEANFRLAMTGTPVENHVGDLWSIMEFLNPGLLGTQAEFKRNYFMPIQVQRDPDATRRLQRATGPFVLRREKTDKTIIADLPEKLEMKVFCTLTKEQASLYEAVIRDTEKALADSDGIQRKGVVLATLSKLKQVCNHPAQFLGDNSAIAGRSGKLARLTEMLDEIQAAGERALVFSQFTEMAALLERHLQETFGREVLFLHGGVSKRRRDTMVERFQNDDDAPSVFLLSLKAGGTGLNLARANHVFHFDRWWNPAVENQATDRAFRIGQSRNVQVHKFLCVGTLEEKIDEMIEHKRAVATDVVRTGERWLTELSNDELHELFALEPSAVGA